MDHFLNVGGWRQVDSADGPVFRRPLGLTELGFYWDTVCNGVAVTVNHIQLVAEEGHEHVLSKENVEFAWLRMKQRFPLLGASVEESPGAERAEFVLEESSLRRIRPGEVAYLDDLHTASDAAAFTEKLHNGPTVLDNQFLARMWHGPVQDTPRRYHVYIPIAHHITDGMGNATLTRELCRELVSESKSAIVAGPPLAQRLELLLPLEALGPGSKFNLPRRRWRLAIASIIRELRQAKIAVSPSIFSSTDRLTVSFTGWPHDADTTSASRHANRIPPHSSPPRPRLVPARHAGLPRSGNHTRQCPPCPQSTGLRACSAPAAP